MIDTVLKPLSFAFAALIMAVVVGLAQFFPTASFWFEVRSMRVFDSHVGDPVVIAVDRSINRDFQGQWVSTIKRLEKGKWVSYCTASGTTNYSTDATLPDPLWLQWWTYPGCHPLSVGKYTIRTTWRIEREGLLPNKWVSVDSNIFEITQ